LYGKLQHLKFRCVNKILGIDSLSLLQDPAQILGIHLQENNIFIIAMARRWKTKKRDGLRFCLSRSRNHKL